MDNSEEKASTAKTEKKTSEQLLEKLYFSLEQVYGGKEDSGGLLFGPELDTTSLYLFPDETLTSLSNELIGTFDRSGDIDAMCDGLEIELQNDKSVERKLLWLSKTGELLSKKRKSHGMNLDYSVDDFRGKLGARVGRFVRDCDSFKGSTAGLFINIAVFIVAVTVIVLPWLCKPLMELLVSAPNAVIGVYGVLVGLPLVILGIALDGFVGALFGVIICIAPVLVLNFSISAESDAARTVYAVLITLTLIIIVFICCKIKSFQYNLRAFRHRSERSRARAELLKKQEELLEECKAFKRIADDFESDMSRDSFFNVYGQKIDMRSSSGNNDHADRQKVKEAVQKGVRAACKYYESLCKAVENVPLPS